MEETNNLYDVTQYSDDELYAMLDLNNPSDRELEAKVLLSIEKYSSVENKEAIQIKSFFEDVYSHFFESDDIIEGMIDKDENGDTAEHSKPQIKELTDYKKVFGKNELSDQGEKDTNLLQTTTLNYGASQLNPLLKETQKRVLQLDSQFRNYTNYPSATDYIINLSETLHNVVSLRLHSVSIPYTWYNISNVYNANYFQLIGNADGIRGVYDLTIGIAPGAYDVNGLILAINESIENVKTENPDINFGTTSVEYDLETSKTTLTLDLQQVYNEPNFYLYFNQSTNTFGNDANKSIPGFLGYGDLVIPKYTSSNIPNSDLSGNIVDVSSVPSAYPLESIYSNYQYSYNATGKISDESSVTYNQFDPYTPFYLVINDPSNNVIGNNYFTICTYDGPNIYSTAPDTSSNVLEKFTVEFGDVSGLYTRPTLLEAINRSLLNSDFLSSNASLNQYDISFSNADDTITTLQRFQLRTLLSRFTTIKKKNKKQVILFPDENEVLNNLPQDVRVQKWQGPLWTGINSCFMFDENTIFTQSNSVRSENEPINTLYSIDGSGGLNKPSLLLQCIKPGYDNSYNNRYTTIDNDTIAGYGLVLGELPQEEAEDLVGYTLNNLIGVYGYDNTFTNSEINMKLKNIKNGYGNDISNGYVNAEAFYDIGSNQCRMLFDIFTYFNETDYIFDLSGSFFDISGSPTPLGLDDVSYGWIPGYNVSSTATLDTATDISFGTGTIIDIPVGTFDGVSTPKNALYRTGNIVFPFLINQSNNKIVVKAKDVSNGYTDIGISTLPDYTIEFKTGNYRTPQLLQDMMNTTFSSIRGITDKDGVALNGLNMSNSKIYIYDGSWVFIPTVDNKFTQEDYKVVLSDENTDASYINDWVDSNNTIRYSLDASGDLQTSSNPGITSNSMWNAYLGFTDSSYSLVSGSTGSGITGSRDVMYDISKTLFVYESNIEDVSGSEVTVLHEKNNEMSFIPQSNVKGLSDANGVQKLNIEISPGIYPLYYLYNEINTKLNADSKTETSIIYSYFDNAGNETTVMQMNINKVYTAEDYILKFYDDEAATLNIKSVNTNSFEATTWDVTLGWILGFRYIPTVYLNPIFPDNNLLVTNYDYTYDDSSEIITLMGNSTLDLYLFKNLYLILNDYTQNHLNDGLITGVRDNPNATRPQYSSSATRICDPLTGRNQSSIFNSVQPGMGLTENQLYAANIIAADNIVKQSTRIYSDPPFVKDMFALIPIKVSGLKQGEVFTEYGGTLQDNDRKYFGPVNISKVNIKLLNDHGDVINLNGSNWSFSLVFEYLYNMKGI